MTAIFGYFNNEKVFMAADRRRSGGGVKEITKSPKYSHIINNLYIASAGSEMDITRDNLIKEINNEELSTLKDIISLVRKNYQCDFKKLCETIEERNEERKKFQEEPERQPEVQLIIFGIDEEECTFIYTLDSADNFNEINKEKKNTVFGTGTYDILIEGRAKQWFNVLINNNYINTAEWTYRTILDISTNELAKDTVDFPADYIIIEKEGKKEGLYNILCKHEEFAPVTFDSSFNLKIS
ncbi:hypothetical protein [Rossellomorea aquimaris]|uniref:Uncharacterized protein n=1 Tax=Rossellomorea aquimaris TaxID=189382 RepID=A0A5D4TRA3_9BACI|nr:hypothetical protein [Rossellomorea aquimaris]TYS76596.1 hypothetical protein FZC80_14935 [Rossellomorea aquimaris]